MAEYEVTLDVFTVEYFTVKAQSKAEAEEKAMDLCRNDYPDAELTVHEVVKQELERKTDV